MGWLTLYVWLHILGPGEASTPPEPHPAVAELVDEIDLFLASLPMLDPGPAPDRNEIPWRFAHSASMPTETFSSK